MALPNQFILQKVIIANSIKKHLPQFSALLEKVFHLSLHVSSYSLVAEWNYEMCFLGRNAFLDKDNVAYDWIDKNKRMGQI